MNIASGHHQWLHLNFPVPVVRSTRSQTEAIPQIRHETGAHGEIHAVSHLIPRGLHCMERRTARYLCLGALVFSAGVALLFSAEAV